MGITIDTDEHSHRIRFDGDLTIYTVSGYRQSILDSCTLDRNLEIDLSALEEIDTAGLQLLAAISRQAMESGSRMICAQLGEVAAEAFDLSRFSEILNCENDDGSQA